MTPGDEERDEGLLRFIAGACLEGVDPDIAAWAARAAAAGVSAEDLAAMRPERMAVYRRLVRGNLLGVASKMMPRTREVLGDETPSFDETFDRFLAEAAPRTHYLRDVPTEFLEWAAARWAPLGDPFAWAIDLGRFELARFAIAASPTLAHPPALAELALDRPVVLNPTARLLQFGHAVHLLPEDDLAATPDRRDVAIVGYRDAENAVRFLELTPLAARIVRALLEGVRLGEAITRSCVDEGTPPTADVLASTATMLAEWGERGLLLGARE